MATEYVCMSINNSSSSPELDQLNRELEEKAKKDKDIEDIIERVRVAKQQPNKGYFVRPYSPRRTNWQSTW